MINATANTTPEDTSYQNVKCANSNRFSINSGWSGTSNPPFSTIVVSDLMVGYWGFFGVSDSSWVKGGFVSPDPQSKSSQTGTFTSSKAVQFKEAFPQSSVANGDVA